MEYRVVGDGAIEVTSTRSFKEGMVVSISPSYGYLGITPGMVQIDTILPSYDADIEHEADIAGTIEAHIEAELSILEGTDRDDLNIDLRSSPWVVYYYVRDAREQGEYYALPLGLFCEHISLA